MRPTTLAMSAVLALTSTLAAPAVDAQTERPVATATVLSLPGGGTVDGDTLYLPLDRQVELRVGARDQYGQPFPQERLRFEFDFDRDCRGLAELVSASDDGVTLRTGKGTGSCEALLWLPNNMNADRRLRIVGNRAGSPGNVATKPATGAFDTREEFIALSLFRAVLARDPDDQWIAAASDEVRRNRTGDLIRSLLASPEFSQRRQTVSANGLLRDVYQGLLSRDPDPAGVRRYLDNVQRGELDDVIREILDSREFRERISRKL